MKKKLILGLILLLSYVSHSQDIITEDVKYTREIKRLANKKEVKTAFQVILDLEPKTIKNQIELTEIEAPPFKEEKKALEFSKRLKETGIDNVWIDSVGNVLGLIKGYEGKRNVAIDGHLDTVFPEGTDVKVRIKNDTLFAPGVADDTRGLAMLLTIAETIKKSKIKTRDNILIIGTVGEEGLGDLRGVKYLFKNNKPKIDSWIAVDGGGLGRINTQGLGSYRYEIKFKGPGGHSWGAFGLANPHHALGDAISKFVEKADEYTSKGPKTSYNVGVINGGTSINSIPYESSMLIDIRSVRPENLDDMEVILKKTSEDALAKQNAMKRIGPNLELEINKIGNRPSGKVDVKNHLVQRAIAATNYMGGEPKLTIGSTDSNVPIALGLPAITIGRGGDGGKNHSLDEWWLNKDGYKAIHLALLILLAETGYK